MGEFVPIRQTAIMAYSGKQLELILRMVASDCNTDEFDMFIEVARLRGLNPFLKQIYAFVFSKDDPKKRKLSIVTSIDGYRLIASRCRDYRPDENAPEYVADEGLVSSENPGGIIKAIVKCWKLGPDNKWNPVAGEAHWDEFAPLKETAEEYDWIDTGETWPDSGKPKKRKVPKEGSVISREPDGKWATMPHVMLSKCAEAQALRKGWPEEFSAVYVQEEMDRSRVADVSASEAVERYEADKRLQLTSGIDTICVVWDPGKPMEAVPMGTFADGVLARLPHFTSLADLTGWKETNRVALNHFWAKSKSDALELKKHIEKREAELRTPIPKQAKSLPGDWQDYLDVQKDELASAKNATETQAIHATVADTVSGARERGEISETDREIIMSAWEELSEK